jgi:hypothetical protein
MNFVLEKHNPRVDVTFRVDLNDTKDLKNLIVIFYELSPNGLSSFMRNLHPIDHRSPYAIDAIKDAFLKTPERTVQRELLGRILRVTFDPARYTMHLAWHDTMNVFKTTDLKHLSELCTALEDFSEYAHGKAISTHDLHSRLGVHALSCDALTFLLRQESRRAPQRVVRAEILNIAKRLARTLEPGLCVDREKHAEIYHRSDENGNTIAHYIADGTLFPGAEQIAFDPVNDTALLQLKNFAGQTVEEVYHARLARAVEVQPAVSL